MKKLFLCLFIIGCNQPDYITSQGVYVYTNGYDINLSQFDMLYEILALNAPDRIPDVEEKEIRHALTITTLIFFEISDEGLAGKITQPGNEITLDIPVIINAFWHEHIHLIQFITGKEIGYHSPYSKYMKCIPFFNSKMQE